jgi:hypothetical protein
MEYYARQIISFGPPTIALYSLLSVVPMISLSKMYKRTLDDYVAPTKNFYAGIVLTIARSSVTYYKILQGIECGGSRYQMSVYTSLILFFDYNVISSLLLLILRRKRIKVPGWIMSLLLLVVSMSVNPVSVISALYLTPSLILYKINNCFLREKVARNHLVLQAAILVLSYPLFNFLYSSLGYFEEIKENVECRNCKEQNIDCGFCREHDVFSFSLTELNYKHFTYTREYVLSEYRSATTLNLLPYLGNLTVDINIPGISLVSLNVLIIINYLMSLFSGERPMNSDPSIELRQKEPCAIENPMDLPY